MTKFERELLLEYLDGMNSCLDRKDQKGAELFAILILDRAEAIWITHS